jgi:hypothetical protein
MRSGRRPSGRAASLAASPAAVIALSEGVRGDAASIEMEVDASMMVS